MTTGVCFPVFHWTWNETLSTGPQNSLDRDPLIPVAKAGFQWDERSDGKTSLQICFPTSLEKFGFGFEFLESRMVLFLLNLPSSPFHFVCRHIVSKHVPFVGLCICSAWIYNHSSSFYQVGQSRNLQFYIPTEFWKSPYPGKGEILFITAPREWA